MLYIMIFCRYRLTFQATLQPMRCLFLTLLDYLLIFLKELARAGRDDSYSLFFL